jgi:AcrR family transcriptional regulator
VAVTTAANRPLRADASRNAACILRAARDVYRESGPDAPVEVIASRAGVGERTLYRRFPTKGELARAALDYSIAQDLSPVIDRALARKDALRGLTELITAAISLGAREHNILAAARKAGSLTDDISISLDNAMIELTTRAQQAGQVRADLAPSDLPRLIAMLNSVLWTMEPASEGWRRYLALVLDALTTPTPSWLPTAVPLRFPSRLDGWPL